MADRHDHDRSGADRDEDDPGVFDLFEPPPKNNPKSFGKVPVIKDAEIDLTDGGASAAEMKAAADAEAAGLQHWTAPPTGQLPAVLSDKDTKAGLWGDVAGPSWHGDDPTWSGPDLADVFADTDAIRLDDYDDDDEEEDEEYRRRTSPPPSRSMSAERGTVPPLAAAPERRERALPPDRTEVARRPEPLRAEPPRAEPVLRAEPTPLGPAPAAPGGPQTIIDRGGVPPSPVPRRDPGPAQGPGPDQAPLQGQSPAQGPGQSPGQGRGPDQGPRPGDERDPGRGQDQGRDQSFRPGPPEGRPSWPDSPEPRPAVERPAPRLEHPGDRPAAPGLRADREAARPAVRSTPGVERRPLPEPPRDERQPGRPGERSSLFDDDRSVPSIDDIQFAEPAPTGGRLDPRGVSLRAEHEPHPDDDYDLYDEDDYAERPAGRNLPAAIGVGVGLIAVLLGVLWAGPEATLLLVVVLALLGVAELYNAMRVAGLRPATLLGIVGTIAAPTAAFYRGDAALPLVIGLTVVFGFLWYLVGADTERPVLNLSLTMMGILWVGGLASFAGLMLRFDDRLGLDLLLAAIIITVASDTMAYVGGRAYGSRPFHHASPNKTWEGTITGFLGAIFAGFAIGVTDMGTLWDGNLVPAMALGAVIGVLAPIGDLAESVVKRDLGVKDMGHLLPGHGGVLDRVDALLFALPGAYYLALITNII